MFTVARKDNKTLIPIDTFRSEQTAKRVCEYLNKSLDSEGIKNITYVVIVKRAAERAAQA